MRISPTEDSMANLMYASERENFTLLGTLVAMRCLNYVWSNQLPNFWYFRRNYFYRLDWKIHISVTSDPITNLIIAFDRGKFLLQHTQMALLYLFKFWTKQLSYRRTFCDFTGSI